MRVETLIFGAAALAALSLSPVSQAADWTGFHAGVLGSVASTRASFALLNDPADKLLDHSASKTRATGGLLFGYDHQFDNRVFGVEADVTSPSGTRSVTACSVQFGCFTSAGDSFTTFNRIRSGTTERLRARFGFTSGDTLFYGAVGYSHMKAHLSLVGNCYNADDPAVPTVYTFDRSKSLSGYNLALGMDHALGERLFLRAEYLFEDFGDNTFTTSSPEWAARRISLRSNQLRLAIGLQF